MTNVTHGTNQRASQKPLSFPRFQARKKLQFLWAASKSSELQTLFQTKSQLSTEEALSWPAQDRNQPKELQNQP